MNRMSSPRRMSNGSTDIREGTRVILKEITASLHNSPVKQTSPFKSVVNENTLSKSSEHSVRVQFAREFADVETTTTPSVTETLSSASSFQSLSSTSSSKSSSGISADAIPESPEKNADISYANTEIPDLDDIIAACADIKIIEQTDLVSGFADLSQDQTFTSAVDNLSILEENPEEGIDLTPQKSISKIESASLTVRESSSLKRKRNFQSVIPYVNFEDSILKTHSLNLLNQDSSVFASAVEFQNLGKDAALDFIGDKLNFEVSDSPIQNIVKSDPLNVESFINASVESQKNESLGLISLKGNIEAVLDHTQSPKIPFLSSSTNSDNLVKQESLIKCSITKVEASSNPEFPFSEINSTEDHFVFPYQESKVKVEVIPSGLTEIPEVAENRILQEIPVTQEVPVTPALPITQEVSLIKEVPVTLKVPITQENSSVQEVSVIEKVSLIQEVPITQVPDTQEVPIEKGIPDKQIEAIQEVPVSQEVLVIEEAPDKRIRATQKVPVISEILITQEHSLIQEVPVTQALSSIQEIPIKQQQQASVTQEVPVTQEDIVKSVAEFTLNEVISQLIPETVEETLKKSDLESRKIQCPSQSPILQSILDKIEEQQKSLDGTFNNDPSENLVEETHPTVSRASDPSGEIEIPYLVDDLNNRDSAETQQTLCQEVSSRTTVTIALDGNCRPTESELEEVSAKRDSDEGNSENEAAAFKTSVLAVKGKSRDASPVKIYQNVIPTGKIIETSKDNANNIESNVRPEVGASIEDANAQEELNSTVILESSEIDLEESPNVTSVRVNLMPESDYDTFIPQQQSTSLAFVNPSVLEKVESEAQAVAKNIYDKSLEIAEETQPFLTATSEIFQDPTSFDFLLKQGSTCSRSRDLRFESLYVKFDPLVNNSMLPQGTSQPTEEEQNGKTDNQVPSVNTPKRNPAIAAIDRLLFYSPISSMKETEETKDTKEEDVESPKPESIPVIDEKMAKELELVRSLVVQLEEKLEKVESDREQERKKYETEMRKQQEKYKKLEEKNSKLESQIAQEIESKKQMTVVLDEYERSISRLVAERERDRADLEEKARMKEELQAASQHLSNTEAAFNDVHQKYERLKGVVAAYKSNETVLKESVQENVETIKALENRYEQLKSHAMAQLEKANQELEMIRKQNEAETVKLQAMLKKAELKSKSLSDLVEQKTKENKELTQILDEVIARVGNQNSE